MSSGQVHVECKIINRLLTFFHKYCTVYQKNLNLMLEITIVFLIEILKAVMKVFFHNLIKYTGVFKYFDIVLITSMT
jgi:hypothetical protein